MNQLGGADYYVFFLPSGDGVAAASLTETSAAVVGDTYRLFHSTR